MNTHLRSVLALALLATMPSGCGGDATSPTSETGTDAEADASTDDGMSESGEESGGVSCDDQDPAAGCPGGGCLQNDDAHPVPWCSQGQCDLQGMFCFDPDEPCRGVDCGGEERGTCNGDNGVPYCVCNEGYTFMMFSLYCYGPDE